MLKSTFYPWLAILAIVSLGLALIFHQFEFLQSSTPLSLFSILFFTLLCLGVQVLATRAARSTNKNLLTQLIMIIVFVKLLFCLLLVMVYHRIYAPSTNYFIFPFLLYYVIYTAFEVIILTRANRLSA